MAYGVSYYEFWDMNPRIIGVYVDAYGEKLKLFDEQAWAIGRYVMIATYIAVGKSFGGEKFRTEYPDRPFSWPKQTAEEIEQAEAEKEIRKAIAVEEAWMREERRSGLPDSMMRGDDDA